MALTCFVPGREQPPPSGPTPPLGPVEKKNFYDRFKILSSLFLKVLFLTLPGTLLIGMGNPLEATGQHFDLIITQKFAKYR